MNTAEDLNLFFLSLNVIFGVLLLAWARLVLGRNGSPILWAYVIVTSVFMYALPGQEYSINTAPEVLLLSHLLMWLFHATILPLARAHTPRLKDLCALAMSGPTWVFFVVAGAWLLWRLQLIYIHGPTALMFSRTQVSQSTGISEFSTLEAAVSSITTLLLMGGMAFLVISHAAGQRRRSPLVYFTAAAVLVTIVLTNESPIGSRRLVLVLAALWLGVNWLRSELSVARYIAKHAKQIVTLIVLMGGLTVYYQHIRNNDFSKILAASSPWEFVMATMEFAAPMNAYGDESEVHYLRSGPFDFFARTLDVTLVEGKSTSGEAILFSLVIAVPKILYPGVKPVGDIDELLLDRLEIYPAKPFLQIDYPTSLPAIGVSDLGPIGVIGAGAVLSSSFAFVGWLLRRTRAVPVAPILALGLFVQLIGSQEGGLTAIVSSLRDALIALMFLVVFHKVGKLLRGLGRASRSFASSAAPILVKGKNE